MKTDAWNPDQYDKFQKERSQPFFDLLDLLQKSSAQKNLIEKSIDLGCGTGELTQSLHRRLAAKETIGLDNSPAMLAKAAAYLSDSLKFKSGSIDTFCEPSTYDLIFSNAAIQWCRDHRQIFKNLAVSLREFGQLAVQMPINQDYPTHVVASEMMRESPYAELFNQSDDFSNMLLAEDYAQMIFDLGFTEQIVRVQVYGHVLDSREDVIEWVKGTLLTRFQSRLSPEAYQDFLVSYRMRLFERLESRTPFFYPFKRILIWAKK